MPARACDDHAPLPASTRTTKYEHLLFTLRQDLCRQIRLAFRAERAEVLTRAHLVVAHADPPAPIRTGTEVVSGVSNLACATVRSYRSTPFGATTETISE